MKRPLPADHGRTAATTMTTMPHEVGSDNTNNGHDGGGCFNSLPMVSGPERHTRIGQPHNALSEIYQRGRHTQNRRWRGGSASGDDDGGGDHSEGDKLLVKELNQLSIHQREEILEELHGVTVSEIEETPEFVERALEAMEEEIQKVGCYRCGRGRWDCLKVSHVLIHIVYHISYTHTCRGSISNKLLNKDSEAEGV
jgi:hypothetical protein